MIHRDSIAGEGPGRRAYRGAPRGGARVREQRALAGRPGAQQLYEAVVLLAARRAAVEVRAHPGPRRLRVAAAELQLDVLVEPLEALVAADLGSIGSEQPVEQVHLGPPSPATSPRSASRARSLRRASCNVL